MQVQSQELFKPANQVFLPIAVGRSDILENALSYRKDFSGEDQPYTPIPVENVAFDFNSDKDLLANLSDSIMPGGNTITFWKKWTAYEASGKNIGLNYLGRLEHSEETTISQFTFSPDERHLVTLDVAEDRPSWRIFSGDSRFLGKQISVWNIENRQLLFNCANHEAAVIYMGFLGNSRVLMSATKDGAVYLWRLNHSNCEQTHKIDLGETILSSDVSTDGKKIAIVTQDNTIHLLDSKLREQEKLVHSSVNTVMFSPDGETLLSFGSLDDSLNSPSNLKIWNSSSELVKEILHVDHDIAKGCDSFSDVRFSPNSDTFIYAPICGSLFQWNTNGELLQTLPLTGKEGNSVIRFSEDGQWLAASSSSGVVTVWDVATGKRLFILSGHQRDIVDIDFFADKQFLVTSSVDSTVRLWRLSDGHIFGLPPG